MLDAISVDTTGATGNVTETQLADREILDANHDKNVKSESNKNKEIDETTDDTGDGVVAQSASPRSTTPNTLRYPFDLDDNQDHLKIQQFEYERPPSGAQGSRPASLPGSGPITDGYREADDVKGKPYGKYGGTVLLPMPKVSDSNGAELSLIHI